jgi:sugar O-acyltransferase (sialic acid O-acetyltransferase NeuD family)
MLAESGTATAAALFDPTLDAPAFDSPVPFLRASQLPGALASISHFIVCIGNEHGLARVLVAEALKRRGLLPFSLRHAQAWVEPSATVGEGALVMPQALLHKFSVVGEQAVLNTACTVDHECVLGRGVHIMGRAALAGRVVVEDYASVGTNATVLPGLRVGEGAFVGAGAVVTRDVPAYTVVAGNPARSLRRHQPRVDAQPQALDQLLTGVE